MAHKLSPLYKNDSHTDLDPKIQDYLDMHYLQKLENIAVAHPKLLVVFSGGNGVGKSSLAARIQQDLQALVLENDKIKQCVLQRDPRTPPRDLNLTAWKYSMNLYERLSNLTPNGLVVRDAIIDWYYDRILPIFEKQGYQLFIIAFDVSRKKRTDLILQRGDLPTVSAQHLLDMLDDHDIHMARFRSEYTPDIALTDETLFDYEPVIEKLQSRLASLK